MAQEYILEMHNISKSFPGVKALDDVTLKIRPGTVHALMGENGAGKSTLMKCLFGIYIPDSGKVILEGKEVQFNSSKDALKNGISMIHQELHPVPYRNVMENIWLGRFPVKNIIGIKMVDHKKMYNDTKNLMEEVQMNIEPSTLMAKLSVSSIQGVEIAKAVSYRSKVIVMDEPTSSLTENEVSHLFDIIRKLRAEGVSIIYISHKMEEILEISDEVTIMRDGKYIGTWLSNELTTDTIISKMVGRNLTNRFPERENTPDEVIMKIEELTSINPKSFKDITFELRRGEILGVGGLVGAQRTELVEAIFGLRNISKGRIIIENKEVKIKSPIDAKKYGIALLTEERRATGIFPVLSIEDNTLIASIDRYIDFNLIINKKRGIEDVTKSINKIHIKTPSIRTLIRDLSGGNQQKVIFSRWLLTEPDILILDEPTRGIDVGAKYEIYTIIADLAKRGKSIIMISSEMPELLGMSDRIMVMCSGKVTGILDGKEASQELIMNYATKFA
ncbi:methyl-galactoside transport system ATP-binding protein [Clostridium tetanomorphum]|uniref:sugar ABC transporter ATP-binding protein n=1 Tax=Clostridium tetanomorphum TaxID=1553 RepID=UPI0004511E11|nr:sugar ABC transporter ATP-binding protein [Clostridium tetanomorphum]KAJ52911.1 galactoside transport ATP-binding protein mglA [Clostridium tetanomorphum DSM 665]MBP1864851.1 methyl-galactoside transport system ATP-binding protein [Clostridium tetanomorphum]NRS83057.1 methyl-galactoside transport system ATP-binding protein [Clostridium tetanomorphum]SQC01096.1 galactoside transport ATP-binding protein mglA [Clostridium tetanomorphum]